MKHIVSFSTGLSSALCVDRVLTMYGRNDTEIVTLDTTIEDEDNWRFFDDCKTRWRKNILILRQGQTPYQIAEAHKIIPNQKVAPCTRELKINPFRTYLKTFHTSPLTIHIGYDVFEAHRCEATKAAYEAEGWQVDFPLLWKPLEFRPYTQVVRQDWNIEPPRTYAMGFSHANCLEWGCVKMGQGDWIRLLINFPERYLRTEQWEENQRKHSTRRNYSIVRDQTNGTTSPLTLKELRLKYEVGLLLQPTLLDAKSSCVNCGIGNLEGQDAPNP